MSPKSTLKCSCGKKTNIQITIIQKIFAQSVIAKHSMGKSGGNIAKYQYIVTLDHKTSQKGQLFEIEMYTSSES